MTVKQPSRSSVPKLDVVLPRSSDGSSFEIYRAASAAQVDVALPDGARPEDFFIDAANYQLPQAVLTRARSCALRIRCVPRGNALETAATLQFYLYVAGTSEMLCGGRRTRLGPGDIVIHDSRRAYETVVTDFDVRIVMVSHDRVPPVFLSPGVHGLRLPADEAGTRLLASAIEGLLREIEGLSVSEADHAVLALCHLAAGLVETHLARQDRDRRRWADPRLDAAMAYVERRYADADLSPGAVCEHLGVSRSGLYRIFAPLGGIDAAIRRRRLDHAMRALLTSLAPTLPLHAFALRHGFRSETHFVRAFQARFGTTPLQFQGKVAAGDRAWLKAQAGRAGFVSLEAWLGALTTGSPDPGAPDGIGKPSGRQFSDAKLKTAG